MLAKPMSKPCLPVNAARRRNVSWCTGKQEEDILARAIAESF